MQPVNLAGHTIAGNHPADEHLGQRVMPNRAASSGIAMTRIHR